MLQDFSTFPQNMLLMASLSFPKLPGTRQVAFAWHFLRTLTIRKTLNWALIRFSFHLSVWFRRPIHWGRVVTLSVEPTTACNLRCPECPSGLRQFTRATGNLREDFFRKTIDAVHRDLCFLIFYFQGEPFLHPAFLNMVRYASSLKVFTVTSTNGHFLSEAIAEQIIDSGLHRLIISLDGTTQEVYEQYRKEGQLERVLEGTARVIAARKKRGRSLPEVFFQFLVVGPNEHQVPEARELARRYEVDGVLFKSAQIYDFEEGSPLIPVDSRFSRYREVSPGRFAIKNLLENRCWKMWHAAVVTWNGLLLPCCFDKDARHVQGDLRADSFHQIWRGPSYKAFRKRIMEGRKHIDICQNCTEGCESEKGLFNWGVFQYTDPRTSAKGSLTLQ